MTLKDKCLHRMIYVESIRIKRSIDQVDFHAVCVECTEDVSEEVNQPGMVYKYDEHYHYWVREFGGYGVKVT